MHEADPVLPCICPFQLDVIDPAVGGDCIVSGNKSERIVVRLKSIAVKIYGCNLAIV